MFTNQNTRYICEKKVGNGSRERKKNVTRNNIERYLGFI